jgi:phage FluMu protein Com
MEAIEKTTFTIANGNTLDVEVVKTNPSFSIRLLSSQDGNVLLENQEGIQTCIALERLKANEIDLHKGKKIEISSSLHKAWFGEYYGKLKKKNYLEEKELFEKHFRLFWVNRELIYQRAEYFLILIPFVQFGLMYSGGFSPTLGSLLELWEKLENEEFLQCAACGNAQILPLSFGGSPLSGQNHLKGYCPRCNQIYDTSVEGITEYFKFCKKYSHDKYLKLSNARTSALKELTDQLAK